MTARALVFKAAWAYSPTLGVLDLARHRGQVYVERFVEQALLLRRVGLALRGELQPLENGVLVCELVDEGLLEGQLGARRAQHLTQLLRFGGVEWVGSDYGG